MSLKNLLAIIIIVATNNAGAQDKQQQKNLGKILNDQKLWQQSKMPTKTIYYNNSLYQVPLFAGQRFYQGEGIVPYGNKTVPKANKINPTFKIKYPISFPFYKTDSFNNRNKSFIRFR
jgi:hypothetical protein